MLAAKLFTCVSVISLWAHFESSQVCVNRSKSVEELEGRDEK